VRLNRIKVERAASCGGLLDGLEVSFARTEGNPCGLAPLCLLGPNGSGKSQLLQLIAEVFQSAWHVHAPSVEREPADTDTLFELDYYLQPPSHKKPICVRLKRTSKIKIVEMSVQIAGGWKVITPGTTQFGKLLPSLIVGYTSGDNETLSLPFLISRSGYARDVTQAAIGEESGRGPVEDNRLLLIDYGTHLEVLVANLLLGRSEIKSSILRHADLDRLASCRCIIQLNHPAAPKGRVSAKRKGIQLTTELESYIDALKRVATCWDYDEKTDTYVFDIFVQDASYLAFSCFFSAAIELYRAFHKLSLLNDLVVPKKVRERLKREARERRFASRLPEPPDDDKVFRFERVRLHKRNAGPESQPVDYVSLSDGEHQQAEIFGIFSMITEANALFVLDEPESHFNPQWRVQFVKRLLDLPTDNRGSQEVLLTSHAPFVPSDISREQVLIFSKKDGKVKVRRPDIETYGATFDRVLEHCFDVHPPISQVARDEIDDLMKNGTAEQIRAALVRLGSSVDKAFLADRLRELTKNVT
jgi:restriction system-associated AAA family ATPase